VPSRYLLDTNIASYFLRARNPQLNRRISSFPKRALAISVLTEAELLFGLERVPEATKLRHLVASFLSGVTILPWESRAAVSYATIRATTQRAGRPIATIDLLIAAHALALNATLVTNDQALRDIPGLICEDWTRS
jgi:tRNA(fMet)-specific endonuclease VapC